MSQGLPLIPNLHQVRLPCCCPRHGERINPELPFRALTFMHPYGHRYVVPEGPNDILLHAWSGVLLLRWYVKGTDRRTGRFTIGVTAIDVHAFTVPDVNEMLLSWTMHLGRKSTFSVCAGSLLNMRFYCSCQIKNGS